MTSKVQASICRLLSGDQSYRIIIVILIIASLAAVFVKLRFTAKVWLSNTFGRDDWVIAFALIIVEK